MQFQEPTVGEGEYVEGLDGAVKKNYDETFDRPPFISHAKQPKFDCSGNVEVNNNGDVIYEERGHEESVPNIDFLNKHGISPTSHPADWFNVFMPRTKRRHANPNSTSIADLQHVQTKRHTLLMLVREV